MMKAGGLGDAKPATPEVQQLCDQLKPELEQQHGKTYGVFSALNFKTQVVAGLNYFIKVNVGDEGYLHVRIYTPLPHTGAPIRLDGCQTSKAEHDEVEYF